VILRRLSLAVALLAGVTGCSSPSQSPGPAGTSAATTFSPAPVTTTATTPTAIDRVYRLPAMLCDAVDYTPVAGLWPTADTPLENTPKLCSTTRRSGGEAFDADISAQLTPGASASKLVMVGVRRTANQPHDLPGVGTDAVWYGNDQTMTVYAYDGNLLLQVVLQTVGASYHMPANVADLAGAVARGTFAKMPHD
jgi:hypothetical protein